jgi:hypothetical protein
VVKNIAIATSARASTTPSMVRCRNTTASLFCC